MSRLCAHCDGSMIGLRRGAIYCSRTCKTAASDQRRRQDGRAQIRDRARYSREAPHRTAYAREKSRQLRRSVVEHFGIECRECGSIDRLELDHVHGNGELHRDCVGHGDAFFRFLLKEFPPECEPGGEFELQVLCRPCHIRKTVRERRESLERR